MTAADAFDRDGREPGSPRRLVVAYVVAALVFLALDACWLTVMGTRLYRPAIGHLMRPDFDVTAAVAFYAIYLLGIVVFAVRGSRDWTRALLRGAAFGAVAYATYDLTNQATLMGWPWHVTMADLAWGAFATGVAAAAARRVAGAH